MRNEMDTLIKQKEFETVFMPFQKGVYSFLKRLTKRDDFAGDCLQDTFLKVYKYFLKGSSIPNPKSLIFRTAYNTYLDDYRRKKNFQSILKRITGSFESAESTEERFFDQERRDQLLKGLGLLNEKDKTLILLYLENLSYKEIAEITGRKLSSMGKTLARAIDKLSLKINHGEN